MGKLWSNRGRTSIENLNAESAKFAEKRKEKITANLCQTGVAASRQRAAHFNWLEKCGGLPTAATMKENPSGSQKGLTGYGRGASCPRSQDNAGRDKAFGLWLFPAKDIK
jgi:hypothetical protein